MMATAVQQPKQEKKANDDRGNSFLVFQTDEHYTVTPAVVSDFVTSTRDREVSQSKDAAAKLEAAWAEVERVIELNRQREDIMAQLTEKLKTFEDVGFWTPDEVGEKFALTPAIPDEKYGDDEDGSTSAPGSSPRQGASGGAGHKKPELTGSSKARDAVHYMPAADLLAPIRRCFTSILRQREDMPKEFTLLLKGIEALQHRVVPVEERMAQSRFKLPLHIPFQAIARLITSTLVPQPTGKALEEWLQTEVKPALATLQKQYAELEQCRDAKTIYTQLEHESAEREKFHQLSMELIDKAVAVDTAMRDHYLEGHRKTATQCDDALTYVRDSAMHITASSKSLVDEIDAVEAKGMSDSAAEFERLTKLLAEAEYRAKKARKGQETYARQVREAMKNFKKEQDKHEAAVKDITDIQVHLARIAEARRQFGAACHERREILQDAHGACLFVNDVISDVTAEVRTGLDLCQQHISRALAEENFRKIRIATLPMDNARDWFRSVGDLKSIREHRRHEIQQRMQGSWQLEFLLSQEEQAHGDVIDGISGKLTHIQREWARLTAVLVDLEVHVPVLSQYDRDATVTRLRQHFTTIEGIGKDRDMKEAHRQLMAIEAAEHEQRQLTLPPIPPPRGSKPTSNRNVATGVRHVPKPPPPSSAESASLDQKKKKAASARSGGQPNDAPETSDATKPPKTAPGGGSTTTLPPPIRSPR